MKVEAIQYSRRVNNKQVYCVKPTFCGNDYYIGKKHKDYHEQTPNNVSNMDIDNLVINRANYFYRIGDTEADVQDLYNSTVGTITGYPKCSLILHQQSRVQNAANFGHIVVDSGTSVSNVNKTHRIDLGYYDSIDTNDSSELIPPKANYIHADYCSAFDAAQVDTIESHAASFSTGAEVKKIKTNKLIIFSLKKKSYDNRDKDFYKIPVTIENAEVIKENITSLTNNTDSYMTAIWEDFLLKKYCDKTDGFANIDFCIINKLKCDLLKAKDAKLKYVESKKCDSIIECEIDTLKTSEIGKISDSTINKLIVTSNKFDLPQDSEGQVKLIEFEKPNGILKVRNYGNILPGVNLQNGKIHYVLTDFKTDNMTIQANLDANESVHINNLNVTEPDAVVTIIGNSKIRNINFKNGGKVILKNNYDGKHPDASKINVINGQVVKDYPIKGLEKIAGMEELKQQLREDIIEPLDHPELYKKYGLDVINGFLMYGPPGCGKTFIANQLAEELGWYFVAITPSNIGNMYQHETSKNLSKKFELAKDHAPSIVFIDELEAIAPSRDGLAEWDNDVNEQVTELLQQLNNCKDRNILVICASNEPQKIDNAIKRTGRMDKKIFVRPPDKDTRKALFASQLEKIYCDKNIDIDLFADKTEYYTAEDIRMILRSAAVMALKSYIPVSQSDILSAIDIVKPSLSKSMVEEYYLKGESR